MSSSTPLNQSGSERISADQLLDLITTSVTRGALAIEEEVAFHQDLVRALFELRLRRENEGKQTLPPLICILIQRCLSYFADLNRSAWIKGDDPGSVDMRNRAQVLQRVLYKAVRAFCADGNSQ